MAHVMSSGMFGRVFPQEPYVLEFVPTPEQAAAVTRLAETRDAADLLPMLLGGAS